jgi:hypothetical protein
MESILNPFFKAQATEAEGAARYGRSEDHACCRNGSQERTLEIQLTPDSPRLRDSEFSYEHFSRY